MEYPEHLADKGLFDRCLARMNAAMENRLRNQRAATDAIGALKNAEAARDELVRRAATEGNIPVRESLAAHRAVIDAQAALDFAREAVTASDAEIVEAQAALNKASGDTHLPVLHHSVDLRIAAAAELDRTLLAVEQARAKYVAAGELAVQAMLRGARHPGGPSLDRGPYGKHPGQHEAAERAAWGLPPKGARLS